MFPEPEPSSPTRIVSGGMIKNAYGRLEEITRDKKDVKKARAAEKRREDLKKTIKLVPGEIWPLFFHIY